MTKEWSCACAVEKAGTSAVTAVMGMKGLKILSLPSGFYRMVCSSSELTQMQSQTSIPTVESPKFGAMAGARDEEWSAF